MERLPAEIVKGAELREIPFTGILAGGFAINIYEVVASSMLELLEVNRRRDGRSLSAGASLIT